MPANPPVKPPVKPFNVSSFMPPARSKQAEGEVGRDSPLRRCLTCYGHLAGVAGVALLDEMLVGVVGAGRRPK